MKRTFLFVLMTIFCLNLLGCVTTPKPVPPTVVISCPEPDESVAKKLNPEKTWGSPENVTIQIQNYKDCVEENKKLRATIKCYKDSNNPLKK